MKLTEMEIQLIVTSLHSTMNLKTEDSLAKLTHGVPCFGDVLSGLVDVQSPYLTLANKFINALEALKQTKGITND